MPRIAPATREPRSAEAMYIRDLQAVWRRAQSLISWGLNPLLDVWPVTVEDADEYNPLEPKARRRPINQMTDAQIKRLWPSLDPNDVRRYAPWATSKDEVIRVAFPGQGLPAGDRQVEDFVSQSVRSAKASPSKQNDRDPFEPNAPGPSAFRLRPLYEYPVLLDSVGKVLPPPPLPRNATTQTIDTQLDWLRISTGELITAEHLEPVVTAQGKRVDRWTTRETKRVLTIDPREDPRVDMQLRQWGQINTNLIESGIKGPIDGVRLRSLLSDVEHTVREAHANGTRVEVLAHQLQERFGVSDSRAALIARDQTLKLNGQLNRSKQQANGVTHYVWRTSRDERVRKSHQKLEGTRQSWDVPPPETGHPGESVQCRCTASPVIPDFD